MNCFKENGIIVKLIKDLQNICNFHIRLLHKYLYLDKQIINRNTKPAISIVIK